MNYNLKAYWYNDGYIRTSGKEFSLINLDNKFIHLTNDAVQKKSDDFGKFENGNKLSFKAFNKYLKSSLGANKKVDFFEDFEPKMKQIAGDTVLATFYKLNPQSINFSFELFGLDFMIDENFKVWLIEMNTNPCIECSCPLLSTKIPKLIENLLRVVVDPIFPPPFDTKEPKYKKYLNLFNFEEVYENNKFELLFSKAMMQPAELKVDSQKGEINVSHWK